MEERWNKTREGRSSFLGSHRPDGCDGLMIGRIQRECKRKRSREREQNKEPAREIERAREEKRERGNKYRVKI